MMGWVRETLGEVCRKGGGRIQTGPFGSQLHESDYRSDGIPVVMPADIIDGKISTARIARVPESHIERLRRHKLSKGDIVYGRRGDIGRQALVRGENIGWLCGTGCLKISLGNGPLSYEFLHRYLSTVAIVGWIEGQAIGATMPNLNTDILERVPVLYPEDKATQNKIAAILSAYDDLIENNGRRVALLEKMAEEIYREWFVRMRFPGHEQAKFEKGVPEGWEVKRISEVVDFLSGYSFKSETYSSAGKYGVVTIKNVQDGYFIPECTDFIEDVPSNMKKHCYLETGDVLMSLTGNVGRVCHVCGDNLLLNQRVAKLAPRLPNSGQFVFFTFNNKSMIQLIENLSLGSTAQMNLSPILLGKQKMVSPSLDMIGRFEDTALPMLEKKLSLLQQNMLLNKFRDRLLPRLISGKLDVENLDIQFSPSMQDELSTQPSPQPSPRGRGSEAVAHA